MGRDGEKLNRTKRKEEGFHKTHSFPIKSYNKEREKRDLTLGNDLYLT